MGNPLPVDCNRAAIWLMGAGDDLDKSGFARSVFSQQRVDFTGLQIERHPFERAHRAKGFRDRRKLEERVQLREARVAKSSP